MTDEKRIQPLDALDRIPLPDRERVDQDLRAELDGFEKKIVVLDDDPTGTQTVHQVPVYTSWDVAAVEAGLHEKSPLFYILTNSRSLSSEGTRALHREIAQNVAAVSARTGKDFIILSRSDSTLRGWYPLETETIRETLEEAGHPIDAEVLCPYFDAGGRYTLENIHYVRQGDELVPAARTEFARDKTFGYTHSSLPGYIEEKTDGRFRAEDTVCISLEDLRGLNYEKVADALLGMRDFQKAVVNAADDLDLKAFCVALLRVMNRGQTFLFRTAASLVKVLGGIGDRPLLSGEELKGETGKTGGIVVVGSHTEKTTKQLKELLKLESVEAVPFNSDTVLDAEAFEAEIKRCVKEAGERIADGKTAVCYTSRTLLTLPDDTKESALARSVKIAGGVQRLVGELPVSPAFVVGKGGITSSDIATKALGIKRAVLLGQIEPGIPVWQILEESRFPGIPFVVFPGNVGNEETLARAVEKLTM